MKLTEEQRKLIEENHNLIYGFLKINELDKDEYYDTAAFGLCKAAIKYDSSKGIFSSFAYKCMTSEMYHQWSYDARKCRIPKKIIYSYNHFHNVENNEQVVNTDLTSFEWNKNNNHNRDVADIITEKEKISKFLPLLKEEEWSIVKYLVSGFNQQEIADKFNISHQAVSEKIKNIRIKWQEYSEKGYITKKKRKKRVNK